VKAYGALDGLVAGLALALLAIGSVVLLRDFSWLGWAIAAGIVLVVGALLLTARLGHGLVDGAVLPSLLRISLLVVLLAEIGAIGYGVWRNDSRTVPPLPPLPPGPEDKVKLAEQVKNRCLWVDQDFEALKQSIEKREGSRTNAALTFGDLTTKAMQCDEATQKLIAELGPKLQEWAQSQDGSGQQVDVPKLQAFLATMPAPNVTADTAPPADAPPARPEYADVPLAELLVIPEGSTTVTVTVEERASALEKLLRLFAGGGLSFGSTKITTKEILGQKLTTTDNQGRSPLDVMAETLAAEGRPDKLAEFWTQLRKLTNAADTSDEEKALVNAVLKDQGPIPTLCHYVLSTVRSGIDKSEAEKLAVSDPSSIPDLIANIGKAEWPDTLRRVEDCVYNLDGNNRAFYLPGLAELAAIREI
jgi:hypothetical protein